MTTREAEDSRSKRQQLTPVGRLAGLLIAGQVAQTGAALQLMSNPKMIDRRLQQHSNSRRGCQGCMVVTLSRKFLRICRSTCTAVHRSTQPVTLATN